MSWTDAFELIGIQGAFADAGGQMQLERSGEARRSVPATPGHTSCDEVYSYTARWFVDAECPADHGVTDVAIESAWLCCWPDTKDPGGEVCSELQSYFRTALAAASRRARLITAGEDLDAAAERGDAPLGHDRTSQCDIGRQGDDGGRDDHAEEDLFVAVPACERADLPQAEPSDHEDEADETHRLRARGSRRRQLSTEACPPLFELPQQTRPLVLRHRDVLPPAGPPQDRAAGSALRDPAAGRHGEVAVST